MKKQIEQLPHSFFIVYTLVVSAGLLTYATVTFLHQRKECMKRSASGSWNQAMSNQEGHFKAIVKEAHKMCVVCDKWDYELNLRGYKAIVYYTLTTGEKPKRLRSSDYIGTGLIGDNVTYQIGLRYVEADDYVYVHPECNPIEECDCCQGFRKKAAIWNDALSIGFQTNCIPEKVEDAK